ncbi:MAG: 2OG-Fe(II) oxygenase [Acidobacteria bacterium]|nr:MAG: 2OG-Fe(II) oxygenase [Acidobacteriota bacterium]
MRVVRLSTDPELLLLRDFVSEDEARVLIEAADAHFKRSVTVCSDPQGCAIEDRTSSSAAIPASEITEAIQTRGKLLANTPVAEEIQVVRYGPGQEFKPHLDAFDVSGGGMQALAQYEGRQREATVLIYLSGPEAGGETVFPELGLRIKPVPRTALFWRNVRHDGSIDPRTLHGGAPVQRGVKYAANLWLRGAQDAIYTYARSENVTPPEPPPKVESAAIIALGVGVGAAVGGPLGAVVGGVAGWTVDAIRRRLITP